MDSYDIFEGKGLTLGSLAIKMASSEKDLDDVGALRYKVFYEEMGAHPSEESANTKRDFDAFDPHCDHLMIIDTAKNNKVVGTYRLIRRDAKNKVGHFYTDAEFDVSKIENYPGEILELGRSCVEAEYRGKPAMQLMWKGLAVYINHYKVKVLFGCGSLHGTDLNEMKMSLSYLYYNHLAPDDICPRSKQYVDLRLMPKEEIDNKKALLALPPLLKGYLRVGGFIGDGAFIDYQFNTTDVCVVAKTEMMTERYLSHYGVGTEEA